MFGQLRDKLSAGKRPSGSLPSGRNSSKFAKLAIHQVPPAHAEPAAEEARPTTGAAMPPFAADAAAARHHPVPLPVPAAEQLELHGVLWQANEAYTPSGHSLSDIAITCPPFTMASELEISESRWHPLFAARPRVGAYDLSAALELEHERSLLLLTQVIAYGAIEVVPMREQPCILTPEPLQLPRILHGSSGSSGDVQDADDQVYARLGPRQVPPVPHRALSAAHIRASLEAERSDFDRALLEAVSLDSLPLLLLSPAAILSSAAAGCADHEHLASPSRFEMEPFAHCPPSLGMTCIVSRPHPLAEPQPTTGFAFSPALNGFADAARVECLMTWAGVKPGALESLESAGETDSAGESTSSASSSAYPPSVAPVLGQYVMAHLRDGCTLDPTSSVVDATLLDAAGDAGEIAPPWADMLVLTSVYVVQPAAQRSLAAPAAFASRATGEALHQVERWLDDNSGFDSESRRSIAAPALPVLALSHAYAMRSSRQYILSPPTTRLAKSDVEFEACRLRLRGIEPMEAPRVSVPFLGSADGRFVERALLDRFSSVGVSARADTEIFVQAEHELPEVHPDRAFEQVNGASAIESEPNAAAAAARSRVVEDDLCSFRKLPACEKAIAAMSVPVVTRLPDARPSNQEDAIAHFMRLRGLAPTITMPVEPSPAAPVAPAQIAASSSADAAAVVSAPRAAGATLSGDELDDLRTTGLQLFVGERAREHRSVLLISLASRVELVHRDFWAPCMAIGVSAAGIFVDANDLMELNGLHDVFEELQVLAPQYSRCWLIVSGSAEDRDAGNGLHSKISQVVLAALSIPMRVIPLVPPTLASARDCVLRALALEQLGESPSPVLLPGIAALVQIESPDEQILSAFLNPAAALRVLGAPEWAHGRALVSFMRLSIEQQLEMFPWLNRAGLDALAAMNNTASVEPPDGFGRAATEDIASPWTVTRCFDSAQSDAVTPNQQAAPATAGPPATPARHLAAAAEGAGFFGYCARRR